MGANFNPKGEVLFDLQRWDLIVKIGLPVLNKPLRRQVNWIRKRLCGYEHLWPYIGTSKEKKAFIERICEAFLPLVEVAADQEGMYINAVHTKLFADLPAILPDLDRDNALD